jgi:hypothetical protein
MKKSNLFRISLVALLIVIAAGAVTIMRSLQFNPDSSHDKPRFGENIAKYDIQPLWLSIQNETDD